MSLFSKEKIMLREGGTEKINAIQVKTIKMMFDLKGLNLGINKKIGNLKFEIDNAIRNTIADFVNKKTSGDELENKEETEQH